MLDSFLVESRRSPVSLAFGRHLSRSSHSNLPCRLFFTFLSRGDARGDARGVASLKWQALFRIPSLPKVWTGQGKARSISIYYLLTMTTEDLHPRFVSFASRNPQLPNRSARFASHCKHCPGTGVEGTVAMLVGSCVVADP